RGLTEDMFHNHEVISRSEELLNDARLVLHSIEANISEPYSVRGLYDILASGFLIAPYLWECKEEFWRATEWRTKLIKGSVKVVDNDDRLLPVKERMERVVESLRNGR
ncbi:MAG TPA: cobalamin-binding protein, partial [Bacillota bacterium]|nr:cobalamin-binding protein [Bacillota bacterium]